MSGIEFSSTFDRDAILKDLKAKQLLVLRRGGEYIRGEIISRTLQGKDANDQAFVGYADSTRLVREDKGLPVGHVDLKFTGDMLGSIHSEVKEEGENIVLEIAPTPDQNNKVAGTNARRPWFSMSQKQKAALLQALTQG